MKWPAEMIEMMKNIICNQIDIQRFKDCLVIYGDLFITSGQKGLNKAINELPEQPELIESWCSRWLTENSRLRLFAFLNEKKLLF